MVRSLPIPPLPDNASHYSMDTVTMPPPLLSVAQPIQMPPPSAGNAAVSSLDDGEDDFEADISMQTGPTGLQPGAFQHYYNDQSQLDASKKSGVIVILMADLLNHEMMDAHKRAVDNKVNLCQPCTVSSWINYLYFITINSRLIQKIVN